MSASSSTSSSPLRVVVVGGVAGGASTAARARRLSESASITLFEKGIDVSFANCGMPFYIGEEIKERGKLSVATPAILKQFLNLDVRTRHEVLAINRQQKTVTVKKWDQDGESTFEFPYDKLVLAPGASPIKPPLPCIDDSRIFTLRTLQDMDAIKARLAQSKRVIIIGAGFIGLEMAEACIHLQKQTTIVEMQTQVLPQLDPEMSVPLAEELKQRGVQLVLGDGINGFEARSDAIVALLKSGKQIEADAVILSIGVKPDSQLAQAAGLTLGARGTIAVNEFQQCLNDPDIYAAGDCVETQDAVLGKRVCIPLAGPASRQARVIADHIFLGPEKGAKPYPGSIGTAIVRVFGMTAGMTGWSEKRLKDEKVPYKSTTITANNHASFYTPNLSPVTIKLLWHKENGKILGAQAFGADGVDKRLDVIATGLRGGMSIDELEHVELCYAPSFGASRDPVNIAAFSAVNDDRGMSDPVYTLPSPDDNTVQILDVRQAFVVAQAGPIPGAIHIPYEELRERYTELNKNKTIVCVCQLGKLAYFARRLLFQLGFNAKNHVGGLNLHQNANL